MTNGIKDAASIFKKFQDMIALDDALIAGLDPASASAPGFESGMPKVQKGAEVYNVGGVSQPALHASAACRLQLMGNNLGKLSQTTRAKFASGYNSGGSGHGPGGKR